MSETYVEYLVARKPSVLMRFLKMLLIMLTVVFALIGFLTPFVVGMLIAIVLGGCAYFAHMNAEIEYEYLYLDRELSVDKVLAKTRRKKAGSYSLEQMEILRPLIPTDWILIKTVR